MWSTNGTFFSKRSVLCHDNSGMLCRSSGPFRLYPCELLCLKLSSRPIPVAPWVSFNPKMIWCDVNCIWAQNSYNSRAINGESCINNLPLWINMLSKNMRTLMVTHHAFHVYFMSYSTYCNAAIRIWSGQQRSHMTAPESPVRVETEFKPI